MTESGTSDVSDRPALDGRAASEITNEVAVSTGGMEWIRRAIQAYCTDDLAAGSECLDRAAQQAPRSLLVPQLRTYLRARRAGVDECSVYDQAEGFTRFIRGGGNVALYEALGGALGQVYRTHRPRRVLDVGPGDGRALVEALDATAGDDLPAFDLVEPAAGLLTDAAAGLEHRGVAHHDHPLDIHEFLRASGRRRRWELAQASFSLQCLPVGARATVLAALAHSCERMIVVEFDVPARAEVFEPAWFTRCVQRVERGVAEYPAATGDRDIVAQQFLVPMLLGFFRPARRANHEQPLAAWTDELRIAGFSLARPPEQLHDYWWAPAYLIEAVPHPEVRP